MIIKVGLLATTSLAALLLAAPGHAQTVQAKKPPEQTKPSQTTPGQSAAGETQAPDSAAGTPETNQEPLPQPGDTAEPAGADAPGDEIVVTGLRASVESSQGIKRNADQIVDAVVAQDIGKLPDLTAAASLARLSGVQVDRLAGEAFNVRIRGLPDVSTTYNGREIFTAVTRNVAIQDFPAGSVGALEVFKSSTANLIEGGIGGQVNVRSRRPFDFDGFRLFGALNGVYTDQAGEVDFNGSILVSDRWETGIGEIGVLVGASYSKLRNLDATRQQSFVIGPAFARQADQPFRFPDGQELILASGNRWRPSATATVQWKPSGNLEVYFDGLFQGFRSRDVNRTLFVPVFGPGLTFSNVVLEEGGRLVQSATINGAVRPDGTSGTDKGKTDTYQGAGGLIWDAGDGVKLTADAAYTDSTFSNSRYNVDYAFASSPVRDVVFDAQSDEGGPAFNFRNFDVSDISNYIYRGLFQENFRTAGDSIQARGDVVYETPLSFLPRIQFGARYSDRNAARRSGALYLPGENRNIRSSALPLRFENTTPAFGYDSVQPIRTFVQPTRSSIRDNIAALRTLAGAPAGEVPFNPVEAFDANEKTYTAYGQIKYQFDPGILIDGVIGLRAIKSRTAVAGTSRNDQGGGRVTFVPVEQVNENEDYLPNVSLRAAFTPELQLRLAFTKTRTQPGFFDLNPAGILAPPAGQCIPNPNIPGSGPNSPNCFRFITAGNPNLRPLVSDNYDISLEWYFARAGSLTGALFRRNVNGFISRISIPSVDPVLGQVNTNLPQNGGDGRIEGAEVSFAGFLDLEGLPQWARGFGVQANYTYIDAEAELGAELRSFLPGQQRLAGVSRHSYNVVALYERPTFSTRLAYNYRSNFVDFYGRIFDPTINIALADRNGPVLPNIHEGLGILDFSANVTPVKNLTVQFDVNNILGTPRKLYRSFDATGDTFPRAVIYLERVFSLGVRFRF